MGGGNWCMAGNFDPLAILEVAVYWWIQQCVAEWRQYHPSTSKSAPHPPRGWSPKWPWQAWDQRNSGQFLRPRYFRNDIRWRYGHMYRPVYFEPLSKHGFHRRKSLTATSGSMYRGLYHCNHNHLWKAVCMGREWKDRISGIDQTIKEKHHTSYKTHIEQGSHRSQTIAWHDPEESIATWSCWLIQSLWRRTRPPCQDIV